MSPAGAGYKLGPKLGPSLARQKQAFAPFQDQGGQAKAGQAQRLRVLQFRAHGQLSGPQQQGVGPSGYGRVLQAAPAFGRPHHGEHQEGLESRRRMHSRQQARKHKGGHAQGRIAVDHTREQTELPAGSIHVPVERVFARTFLALQESQWADVLQVAGEASLAGQGAGGLPIALQQLATATLAIGDGEQGLRRALRG
jgi:hypothetical protein